VGYGMPIVLDSLRDKVLLEENKVNPPFLLMEEALNPSLNIKTKEVHRNEENILIIFTYDNSGISDSS
jgi:hypothetical protein